MNPHHLTRIAFLAASKRLGGVRVPNHRRFFTYVHRANNSVIRPVHTVTNTCEANRDVLTSKQNKLTTGPNANAIVSQYDYTVNAMGQRVSRTQSGTAFDGIGYAPGTQLPTTMTGTPGSGTSTDLFNYNPRGEVENSTNNLASNFNRSYSYDPIGNRLNTTEGEENNPATNPNAKTYTTNALNQYTQINTQITTTPPAPPTTAQPTYDADGNMLTDGTGKTYTWDCENRLIQVTLPNNEIVKYYYDAGSHRIKREHLTPTTTTNTLYLYDDWNVIEERTNSVADAITTSQVEVNTYLWGIDLSNSQQTTGGIGGLLTSKFIKNGQVQLCLAIYDGNGNVGEVINQMGEIVAHYCYGNFGEMYSSVGVLAARNCFRSSSKLTDDVVGLSYYGFRFYDANSKRWINRDISGKLGGINLYCFNLNNPINSIDILGLSCTLTSKARLQDWEVVEIKLNQNLQFGTGGAIGSITVTWMQKWNIECNCCLWGISLLSWTTSKIIEKKEANTIQFPNPGIMLINMVPLPPFPISPSSTFDAIWQVIINSFSPGLAVFADIDDAKIKKAIGKSKPENDANPDDEDC